MSSAYPLMRFISPRGDVSDSDALPRTALNANAVTTLALYRRAAAWPNCFDAPCSTALKWARSTPIHRALNKGATRADHVRVVFAGAGRQALGERQRGDRLVAREQPGW